MILIDANQVAISTLMAESRGEPNTDIDLMRHMFVNCIRNIRRKFKKDYGEIVLCWDAGNYWRKELFPHYKASRKKQREESDVDWDAIFTNMHKIREEIKQNFPYKVLKVERCEADDIIATVAKQYAQVEDVLIVSSDEDFLQLQIYPSVRQWSPMKGKFLDCENPKEYLARKIMKGDTGDGVPNFLSDDDVFVVDEKRQKPLLEKNVVKWLVQPLNTFCDERMLRNYERNESLVSLFRIPEQYRDAILDEYGHQQVSDRSKILSYFIANRMKLLIENIEDF
jgi:5'-3' exonuclease